MTAVALLFSIYMVKPSPFCVLDELDAPLDESNINRFVKVLKRFLNQSQFVVITHNKRTIGMADVLYGVTMQEQGVSRVVSVRFRPTDASTESPRPADEMTTDGNGKDNENGNGNGNGNGSGRTAREVSEGTFDGEVVMAK
jgi:chromosome segregation protein